MQEKARRPYNKSMLVGGISLILIGLILGICIILFNLNTYANTISKYTESDKIAVEKEITLNDENYNYYVEKSKELTATKQKYQREIAKLHQDEIENEKYLELDAKITEITKDIEEVDSKKYASVAKKNQLRQEYEKIESALNAKENPFGLVKCYIIGLVIIIITLIGGACLINYSFQPDMDEIILNNQKRIDAEFNKTNKSKTSRATSSKPSKATSANKLANAKKKTATTTRAGKKSTK